MTRVDVINELSRRFEMTQKEAATIVETIFTGMAEGLARGEKIEIRGFGTFRIHHRRRRTGRNPKTGASIDVPPTRVPFFRAGKEIKQLLAGSRARFRD